MTNEDKTSASENEVKDDKKKEAETKPEEKKKEETKPEEKKETKESKKTKSKAEEEKIAALEIEVAQLKGENANLKNAYAKAYADTENMKKRLQKDFENQRQYQFREFALAVLPVLDDCERALSQETKDDAYRKGVEMIYNKLKDALKAQGVEEIEAEGKPFDGNWHQALMSEHVDGTEPGMVIQVLQKGYKMNDRILRAAMVKVSE